MERIKFTSSMKHDYTILIPDMTTIHFKLLARIFNEFGYKVEVLYNQEHSVIDSGLNHVHNDTCYPALLVIGQMIDALNSGKYDPNRTALLITQTGGGCRASNYIHLLRKALIKANYGHVPVLSLNFAGLEKDSGFKLTLPMLRRGMAAITYGDLLMLLNNQIKPYETVKGTSGSLVDYWINELCSQFRQKKGFTSKNLLNNLDKITQSFAEIEKKSLTKIKVGIVGEIYVKYAALGNNNLETFLSKQDCEVMVPGLLDFCIYSVYNTLYDSVLYGGGYIRKRIMKIAYNFLDKKRNAIISAVKKHPMFIAPSEFDHIISLADGVIGHGCKMGEGWFLTAEMLELIELGYPNIICVQPFGCLPNHIVGRGMLKKITSISADANIVPIDFDPGATKVNQENRVKLMLAVAKEKLQKTNA